MKKLLISLISIIILTQGCTSDKKKALEYNNKIAKLSTNYIDEAKEFGVKLKTAITTKDFSKLQEPYDELNKIIADDISQINKLESVSGSEDMKTVMMDYLKFEQDMIVKGFGPFTKMTKTTTDKEIKAATDDLMDMVKKESDYLVKVRKVQQEFATKNGFQVGR